MTSIKYELNTSNLVKLGVCDAFYELYCSLYKEYDGALTFATMDMQRTTMRKKLDEFLEDYTYVFTEEYSRLHPNAYALKAFNMFDFEHKELLHLSIKRIPFPEFLRQLQDFVVRIIWKRKSYVIPKSEEFVWQSVNQHICHLVAENSTGKYFEGEHKEITMQHLWVFENLSGITCNKNNHLVLPHRLSVQLVDKEGIVILSVHKCMDCGRMFIGNATLHIYEKTYGKMLISIRKDDTCSISNYDYCGESPLHQAGYNVIEGKMTDKERHKLLMKLLETGSFTYFEICRDIENAIRIFNNNSKYIAALHKWRSDLWFLAEYIKEKMQEKEANEYR